jgi:hypothetical protein
MARIANQNPDMDDYSHDAIADAILDRELA